MLIIKHISSYTIPVQQLRMSSLASLDTLMLGIISLIILFTAAKINRINTSEINIVNFQRVLKKSDRMEWTGVRSRKHALCSMN